LLLPKINAMLHWLKNVKRRYIALPLAIGMMFVLTSSADRYFEISKNLEIFTSLFRELNTYYVDDIDPAKLMETGINSMLGTLDPFTNYITGAELDDYQLQTTGKYGGIGARISRIGDYVVITEPYENSPAHKAGLEAGDAILEIDGKSVKGLNSEEVTQFLRGQPGTTVKVKIRKDVSKEEKLITITRGDIQLENVPYYGMLPDGMGYIKLVAFSENAGKEVADALKKLKENNAGMKGVVLDLRGNGGGLLHEAINVSNVFVDKGIQVVSTKGKIKEANKNYETLNKGTDTQIPLVVLTDGGSASASEIVSGSLQDLDRGIVIGQRTYGKGLVQITRPIAYKAKLKVTTSKYYIPSGRCIQAIDYSNRDLDGTAHEIPDSLRKAFKTRGGRTVLDGAGIDPDIKLEPERMTNITMALYQHNLIFLYANIYKSKHPELRGGNKFSLTNEEYSDFLAFLKGKEYDYTTTSEEVLKELKETAKEEHYYDAIKSAMTELEKNMMHDKDNDLIKHKAQVSRALEMEIVSRYGFQKGRIENSLADDPEVLKAIEILNTPSKLKSILTVGK
jgi:carboxyl-terminal processing protease